MCKRNFRDKKRSQHGIYKSNTPYKKLSQRGMCKRSSRHMKRRHNGMCKSNTPYKNEASTGCVRETPQIKNPKTKPAWDV